MYDGDGFVGFENSLSSHVMKNANAAFGREIYEEAMGSTSSKHLKRSVRLAGGGAGGGSSSSSSSVVGGSTSSGDNRDLRLWEFVPELPQEAEQGLSAFY